MSFLASYQGAPNHVHYEAALHALRYLVSTSSFGIYYHSDTPTFTESFVHLPPSHDTETYADATPHIPDGSHESTSYYDAFWGSQTSNSIPNITELLLYKFCSMPGHIITQYEVPLYWKVLQKRRTALSSAESKITANNECVKDTNSLRHRSSDIDMIYITLPTIAYNDNRA